ncbi:hypothetical protein ACLOJK_004470, partial [Asimina triloba]
FILAATKYYSQRRQQPLLLFFRRQDRRPICSPTVARIPNPLEEEPIKQSRRQPAASPSP